MIGILIVAHGNLGESLIRCASHVLGKRPEKVFALSVRDDPMDALPIAQKLVAELDEGQGVLVFTDIYGASPSNVTAKLLVPGKVEGIAGVNLPMLIRALTYRERTLSVMITKAISGGCEGVLHMTKDACYAPNRN